MGPSCYPTYPFAQPSFDVLRCDSSNELHVSLDELVIRQSLENAQSDEHRESIKSLYNAIYDLVGRRQRSDWAVYMQGLKGIQTVLAKFSIQEYRPCVEAPSIGRSLLQIVHEILDENRFDVLGPVSQLPGKATGDHRFICIFCHEVKVKTGDLRVHLANKHGCDWVEIKKLFHRSRPEGLQVFGEYSYHDVTKNRWLIKDWRERKPRSEASGSIKRKRRSSGLEASSNVASPILEENASQPPALTGDTTTISASPLPQTLPDLNIGSPLVFSIDHEPSTGDGHSSMESSCGDLLGIGTSESQRNLSKFATDAQTVRAMSSDNLMYIDPQLLSLPDTTPWSAEYFDRGTEARTQERNHHSHKTTMQ